MDAAVVAENFPARISRRDGRPANHYRSLPRTSRRDVSEKRELYRRSMAMALRSTTFYNPILDKEYRHPVEKPSSYRDPTGAKQQEQARKGVKVNPSSAAKTAGAKGKAPMRPAPAGRGGNRRHDQRDIAYGYTGNPLAPEPW
jgi:hypothetical protein